MKQIFVFCIGTPSPTKYPCRPGTYSNSSDLYAPEQCSGCPEGSYCPGGEPYPRGLCPPGYYCPARTRFAQEFPCPNGTYNLHYGKSDKSQCEECTLGHFCELGTVEPIPCPIGKKVNMSEVYVNRPQ